MYVCSSSSVRRILDLGEVTYYYKGHNFGHQLANCLGYKKSLKYSQAIPTEKYAGCDEAFFVSALSPSQFWIDNTTDALLFIRKRHS